MRAALIAIVLVALTSATATAADPFASKEGQYKIAFPGAPKLTTKATETKLGALNVATATYANADGGTFMVSYTDFPEGAIKPDGHAAFFDGVRDGVLAGGKLIDSEADTEFGSDKLPSRGFTVSRNKQHVKFRAILRGNRLYQVAVIGSDNFVVGKDAKAFFNSFELTK